MTLAFPPPEAARLADCVSRLTPHLELNRIALTGGVAMQVGLTSLGLPGVRHCVADLDLVATSLDSVRSSVVNHFLVSHYHVVRPGVPKFMIQLVDPVSRIRIDVFPDLADSVQGARQVRIGEHVMLALRLDTIFDHKHQTLVRATCER